MILTVEIIDKKICFMWKGLFERGKVNKKKRFFFKKSKSRSLTNLDNWDNG